MAAGSKPPFAFFVETCQEQQDYLQQIWRTSNAMEEQVDITELCKLTKERWNNLTQDRRKAYVKVVNDDEGNEEQKKPSFPVEQSCTSTSDVAPASKVCVTPGGKKKKDQLAPKRTKSAYTFYLIEEGKCVREANPNWKLGEVTKELGRRWSGMERQERKKYCDMAARDRMRFDEEMRLFETQCRERGKLEESMEEQKLVIEEDNVALTNKQVEEDNDGEIDDLMDVEDSEAKESNLIECRERLRTVIEFGGLKQKIDRAEMRSVARSSQDQGEIKVDRNMKMVEKLEQVRSPELEQEETALKWKEKRVADFKQGKRFMLRNDPQKMGYNFKEKSLKDFIAKETLLADEGETKSCLDFVMKHYGLMISYEDIQNHKLKIGQNNIEGIDLNINDEITHDFKRWKKAHDHREASLKKFSEEKLKGNLPLEIESFEDFVTRSNKEVESAKKMEDHEDHEVEDPVMDIGSIENSGTSQCISNSDYSELKRIVQENLAADQLEIDSVVDLLAKDTKMVDSSKMILNAEFEIEEDKMDMGDLLNDEKIEDHEFKIEDPNMEVGSIENNEAAQSVSHSDISELKEENPNDLNFWKSEYNHEDNLLQDVKVKENSEIDSSMDLLANDNEIDDYSNILLHSELKIEEDNIGMGGFCNSETEGYTPIQETSEMKDNVCDFKTEINILSVEEKSSENFNPKENTMADQTESESFPYCVSKHNNMVRSPNIIPSNELGKGSNHNNMVGSPHIISSNELGKGSNDNNMVGSPHIIDCAELGIGSNHNNRVGSPCKQLGIDVSNDSANMIPSDTLGIEKEKWIGIEDREGKNCILNVEESESASRERSGEINTEIASSLPTKDNLDALDKEHDAFGKHLLEETPTEDTKEKIVVNKNQDSNLNENNKVIQNQECGKGEANMDTGAIENNENLGCNSISEDLKLNEKMQYDFEIEITSHELRKTESKNPIAKENSKADALETESVMESGAKSQEFVINLELAMENVEDSVVRGVNEELNCKVEISNDEFLSNTLILGSKDVVHNATENTVNGDMKENNEDDK